MPPSTLRYTPPTPSFDPASLVASTSDPSTAMSRMGKSPVGGVRCQVAPPSFERKTAPPVVPA